MNIHPCFAALLLVATAAAARAAAPRFAPHEIAFDATSTYANPYVDVVAEAILTPPDHRAVWTLPLFWNGGVTWKLRVAPDATGTWQWAVKSNDPGLNGRRGSFECVASDRRGSIRPLEGAPRHFQYQNGERMWFMGDTAWAYVTDSNEEKHDRAAAERYLTNRAAQGFNVIHLMLLNEAGWPNRGGPPWQDIGREQINPAYFQEADQRIAFANTRGVVTGLALAWGNKGRNEPYSWMRLPGLEARLRYARYVAARYSAYDVYFLVSGEWHGEVRSRKSDEATIRREFVGIGDALRGADPHRRMIGIHPMTAHGSTREFNAAATWMDFADYQQNYRDLHERALASRAVAKPVINSEYAYFLRDQNGDGQVDKPHSYTVDDIRHATWDIAMAGTYLVAGFGSTYMGGNRHPTPFLPDDPRNRPWEEQIGRVKRFFESREYWRLEPHDELLACRVPRGEDRASRVEVADRPVALTRAPAVSYWCLAEPGREYAIYVRGTRAPVALTTSADARWTVERHDPRTGAVVEVATPGTGPAVALAAPDEQDWVFVVRRRG